MSTVRVAPSLEQRLKKTVAGEVLADPFSLGRYATDASSYQVMPRAVICATGRADIEATLDVARNEGVPVTARGAGTSQCGQAINEGIILDTARAMNGILAVDVENKTCSVQPGVVLDELNRALSSTGLWFPVDISTSSRATIGGMAGNNSCGGRSLRYGTMADNVMAIEAVLADGSSRRFEEVARGDPAQRADTLLSDLLALGAREADEIKRRFPEVQRRVGGYNLDVLTATGRTVNPAQLLVGSEGTLAISTRIDLRLSEQIGHAVMGVCHFGSFFAAMEAAQKLVALKPIALELVDQTMIGLGRNIPIYRETLEKAIRGEPDAVLIAEFADGEQQNARRLEALAEAMNDLGLAWEHDGDRWGGVVPVVDPDLQNALTEVRKGGLNIMMSMKQAGKPVSFVEDCAVPLEHLAAYTEKLTTIFAKHGTTGTWYAHASVGCLHVRPILNLKLDTDLRAMRAIAEEAFELVRQYKGSHSGEHGDGIVRSEFHEAMFGRRLVAAFEEVKDRFDERGLLNPGRIVRPPKMDDRRLLRFGPAYRESEHHPRLDWSAWPGGAGGFQGAVEMCNNNGACRKLAGGVMCPSWRATGDEKHVVRGRANTLRLALSGQLGDEALTSEPMREAMELCVSCKACRRECPTGVDMAAMKIEVLAARAELHGSSARDKLIAYLPRYAPIAAKVRWLATARDRVPGLAQLSERMVGLTAERPLPVWAPRPFRIRRVPAGPDTGRRVALFADTFNIWFEPRIIADAVRVLVAAGYRVEFPQATSGSKRPLCCGRTFLSVGRIDLARAEMERTAAVLAKFADDAVPILGLEPSCLLTFRDELAKVQPGERSQRIANACLLLEEFLVREDSDLSEIWTAETGTAEALVHPHCHQRSFGAADTTTDILNRIPGMSAISAPSGCCGMAGAFGYQAETYAVSMKMADLSLLPKVRAAPANSLIVAPGTSCRHQITHGTGREVLHPVQVMARALAS